MPDSPPSLPTSALLRTAYNVVSARIFAGVKASRDFDDLRPAHGNAMEQLELQDGLRLTEMAARAGITLQSMGELVDDLEARGYLERRPDPDDRRAKRIHLTTRGRKNARIAKQAVADVEDHLADLLGQQHYQQLRWSLQQIIARAAHGDEQRNASG